MAHDVFISHSSKDKTIADATCAWLESRGIRCWVAPRDIRPGANWGSSIIQAIRGARVMILVFSSHANTSPQIKREVERAVHFGVSVIPMRIEDVFPEDDLEYFLGMPHWLDAFTPPLEQHLDALVKAVKEILEMPVPSSKGKVPEDPITPGTTLEPEVISEPFSENAEVENPDADILWASEPPPVPTTTLPVPPSRIQKPETGVPQTPAPRPPNSRTIFYISTVAAFLVLAIIGGVIASIYRTTEESSSPQAPGNVEANSKQPPATATTSAPTIVESSTATVVPAHAPKDATTSSPTAGTTDLLNSLQKSAEQGNIDAQYQLGVMYQTGRGVTQDYAAAISWYQKAAAQDNVSALTNLGEMYAKGMGVPQDYPQALNYYLKAANLAGSTAQSNVGLMYANGWGVPKDYVQAVGWFQKSADQGNADAQASLGWMYASGWGVPKDYTQAVSWFQKSVDQGNTDGETKLAAMYQLGYGVKQDLAKARSLYQKAADQGNVTAQADLLKLNGR